MAAATYTFLVPLVAGIIVFVIAIFGFMFTDQSNPPFWVWVMFYVGIVIILLAIIMHAMYHVSTALPAGQYYYYRPDIKIEDVAVDYPRYAGPLLVVPKQESCQLPPQACC